MPLGLGCDFGPEFEVLRRTVIVGEFGIAHDLAGKVQNNTRGSFDEHRRTIRLTGIRPECCANYRPAGRQRASRPPNVQGGNMPMPNGLLAPRMSRNAFDWQVNFYEAFGVYHDGFLCCDASLRRATKDDVPISGRPET